MYHRQPPAPEPEPYEADLIEQDALIEDAVLHIRRLTQYLIAALPNCALRPDVINRAEGACHAAELFASQFDDPADRVQ
jgi:hypothetical protein